MKKKTKQNAAVLSAITLALVSTTTAVSLNSSTVYAEENDYVSGFGMVESTEQLIFTNTLADKHHEIESYIGQIVAQKIGENEVDMSFEYNDVYSPNLIWTGNVIDFTYNDDEYGYALFRRDNDDAVLAEIVFESASPYYGKDGKYIYISYGSYAILHDDGSVEQFSLDTMPQNRPMKSNDKDKDDGKLKPKTYTFDWCRFSSGKISGVNVGYKNDMSLEGYSNNCANVAGVIMLNYWNKKYNNQILNLSYPSEMTSSGDMTEGSAGKHMDIFYSLMNTNWLFGNGGTLPENVVYGFQNMVKQKGFTAYATKLTYPDEMRTHLKNGEPLFITSKEYYFASSIPIGDTQKNHIYNGMKINYYHYEKITNAHTFVAYGYDFYEMHYEQEGAVSVLSLLTVANGWGGTSFFSVTESDVTLCTAIRVEVSPTLSRC